MTELFEPYNYELEKIKISELNKQTYYAKVDGDTVKIYTVAPAAAVAVAAVAPVAAAQPKSLFDMIDDTVKNYVLGNDATPDDAVPFYVITGQLDDLNNYKVSDNLYILPRLTPEKIDAKVNENKVAAETAEQERLNTAEADRIADENKERLNELLSNRPTFSDIVKIENSCHNKYIVDGNIYIEDDEIDYECFTYFHDMQKIKLINVTNIKDIFSHIQNLIKIEEIEIISNDEKQVLAFATEFNQTITDTNISMLLSTLTNLKRIKLEYMIDEKRANVFLSALKQNIYSLNSISICPSSKYFNTMRQKFKTTNNTYIYKFIHEGGTFLKNKSTEEILKKIQEDIDKLLNKNQINYTNNPMINRNVKTSNSTNTSAAEQDRLGKIEAERLAAEKVAEQDRLGKIEAERLAAEKVADQDRLAKVEADKLVAERAEKDRLAKVEADKLVAERAEKDRLFKIEADKPIKILNSTNGDISSEESRIKEMVAKKAEKESLAKIAADKLVAENAEKDRLFKIEADRIAAEKAEQERLVKENAEKEKVKIANPSTNLLPPPPPSKEEEEETARITNLLQAYRQNIKKADYRKGLPNSKKTISGLSQTNACYINAMLQMLIDIDEFLEYILFMNETKKQQEIAKLITDANNLVDTFSNIVINTENLSDFFLFVYNVLRTDNQPECNDNNCVDNIIALMRPEKSNVDSQILMVQNIIQMFEFRTSEDNTKSKNSDGSAKRQLTSNFKNNSNKDIKLIDDNTSVLDYKKYIEFGKLFGVEHYNAESDFNFLNLGTDDLPSPLNCLSDLKDKLVKIKDFEIKQQIITALKYIFEFVINGIKIVNEDDPVIDNVIIEVNNIQRLINLLKGQQEDASAVYSLLNSKFNDELFQKYGLKYNKDRQIYNADFLSPLNLQANDNGSLSEVIKGKVSMKDENKDNQRYIIFGNSQSSNTFDQITIEEKTFNPIGIVQHIGASSNVGSMGGHYVYYSFKSNKLLNDKKVSDTSFTSNISYTRCVVLYERVESLPVGSSSGKKTTPGGSGKQKPGGSSGTSSSGKTPTKFRASRRKQIKKAPSI
jgi:hypothetical protein